MLVPGQWRETDREVGQWGHATREFHAAMVKLRQKGGIRGRQQVLQKHVTHPTPHPPVELDVQNMTRRRSTGVTPRPPRCMRSPPRFGAMKPTQQLFRLGHTSCTLRSANSCTRHFLPSSRQIVVFAAFALSNCTRPMARIVSSAHAAQLRVSRGSRLVVFLHLVQAVFPE